MGFFNKLKNAVEDKVINKVVGNKTSVNTSYSPPPEPQYDAAHEARMEEERKRLELERIENERKAMQFSERMMGKMEKFVDSSTETVESHKKNN